MKNSENKELLRFQLSFLQMSMTESQVALFPLPQVWSFPSLACPWHLYPQAASHLEATVREHLYRVLLRFLIT